MSGLSAGQALQQAVQLRSKLTIELTQTLRELPLILEGELRAKEAAFHRSLGEGEAISTTRDRQWVAAIDFTAERLKAEAEIKALEAEIAQVDAFIEVNKIIYK